MEDINLKEYFKIDDSHSKIRGFVVIRDEDGSILVKKENMIVRSGRQMILDAITGGTSLNIEKFQIGLSESTLVTDPTMKLTGEVNQISKDDYNTPVLSVETDKIDIDNEDEKHFANLTVTYTVQITAKTDHTLASIFLYNESGILFSRAVFNPIGISQNNTVTITYTIYF